MKGSLKACFHWQWIWTHSFSWSGKSTYDPEKMEKKIIHKLNGIGLERTSELFILL